MKLLRPMLAAKTSDQDLQNLQYPMYLSPKIDGIRALVVDGKLVSRSMKLIPNRHTQELFGRSELNGLDGELVVGNPWDKNLMQQTTSGVMSFDGTPSVVFWVFDRWNDSRGYTDRLNGSVDKVYLAHELTGGRVCPLGQILVDSYQSVLEWESHFLAMGYEGVMLRSPNGPYKQNRSTLREGILLKIKRFYDAEAIITGYEALNRNTNEAKVDERGYTKRSHSNDGKVADDLLGALYVSDLSTGVNFSIGSGFTEAQRYDLWENRGQVLGKIVKYKCFNATGVKDKPRFPIFLGFRSLEDM